MTSITGTIRHYQRGIDRSVNDEARLLHCIDKLNKLPIKVKYLQETKIGRTVNNLRRHDGVVGQAATELVAKWKRKVEAANVVSSGKDERPGNTEFSFRNNYTDRQKNGTSSTPNSMSRDQTVNKGLPVSWSTDSSKSSFSGRSKAKSSRLVKKSSKNCDEKMSKSQRSSSSVWGDCKENNKSKDCGKTNNKKHRRDSDIFDIDIDSKIGTSFDDALRTLDVLSKSTVKKSPKSALYKASIPKKRKKSNVCSPFDETPILLTKRPELAPLLHIADEILSPSTVTEPTKVEIAIRKPEKQTDQETIIYSITSRTTKTKVFSGNKAGSKCEVPALFDMCIHLLKDNINLLEFTGGVPFDILRPVLERTTCEQLMILEDYNPYLMEDTHCLWEQHCKRRFRTRSREELETWREMYIRCLDEECVKFNSLTAAIKLSKERQRKTAYADINTKVIKNTKVDHARGNILSVSESGSQKATKSKDSIQIRKRSKKSNDDPDWTPTTWYKTLYKKKRDPKPPKPPIKKTIDMLRYDRAKALEKTKEEWKKRPS